MLIAFCGPPEVHKAVGRGKHRACSPTVADPRELRARFPGLARRGETSVQLQLLTRAKAFTQHTVPTR